MVWGDSIAASGWPQQVEFIYNVALNTGRAVRVINSGVGGKPASHARNEFDTKVAQHKPEVVFIQFGFNDMRYDGVQTQDSRRCPPPRRPALRPRGEGGDKSMASENMGPGHHLRVHIQPVGSASHPTNPFVNSIITTINHPWVTVLLNY